MDNDVMKKKVLFMRSAFPLTFFLATSSALANLGETLDESIARYGPVLKQEIRGPAEIGTHYIFEKNGFTIDVSLLNGRTEWICYTSNAPILDDIVGVLLENNAQNSKWGAGISSRNSLMRRDIKYGRLDRKADAEYEEVGTYNGLQIITKAWHRARSPEAADL